MLHKVPVLSHSVSRLAGSTLARAFPCAVVSAAAHLAAGTVVPRLRRERQVRAAAREDAEMSGHVAEEVEVAGEAALGEHQRRVAAHRHDASRLEAVMAV